MIALDCEDLPALAEFEAFLFEGVLGEESGTNSGASALNVELVVLRASEVPRTRRPSIRFLRELCRRCVMEALLDASAEEEGDVVFCPKENIGGREAGAEDELEGTARAVAREESSILIHLFTL